MFLLHKICICVFSNTNISTETIISRYWKKDKKINFKRGCGKSNLLSAITWVLSYNEIQKELIDTILFQGNEDIIIKRRLERNGNESFFLNNNQLSDFEYFSKAIVACVN